MKLSRTNHAALGVGDGVISVDGLVPAPLLGVVGGGTCWMDDGSIIYQRAEAGRYWLETLQLATGRVTPVDGRGANQLVAGGGVWAAWLAGDGYRDSLGRKSDRWYPLAVDDISGSVALCTDYQNGAGLAVLGRTGQIIVIHMNRLDRLEACYHDGILSTRRGGIMELWPGGQTVDLPIQGVQQSRGYAIAYADVPKLCVYKIGETWGLQVSTDDRDFNPDIRLLDDGGIALASSRGQGERPSDLRRYAIDFAAGLVNGQKATRVPLTGQPIPPDPPVPPIPPIPPIPPVPPTQETCMLIAGLEPRPALEGKRFVKGTGVFADRWNYPFGDGTFLSLVDETGAQRDGVKVAGPSEHFWRSPGSATFHITHTYKLIVAEEV